MDLIDIPNAPPYTFEQIKAFPSILDQVNAVWPFVGGDIIRLHPQRNTGHWTSSRIHGMGRSKINGHTPRTNNPPRCTLTRGKIREWIRPEGPGPLYHDRGDDGLHGFVNYYRRAMALEAAGTLQFITPRRFQVSRYKLTRTLNKGLLNYGPITVIEPDGFRWELRWDRSTLLYQRDDAPIKHPVESLYTFLSPSFDPQLHLPHTLRKK